MAKIKSAWEIALEKTEAIEVDREKLRKEENIRKAKALAGSYLNYDEEMTAQKLANDWKETAKLEGAADGIRQVVMQNLTLPSEQVLNDRYERLGTLLSLITTNPQAMELMNQISSFCKQYPEHQKQLVDQLKERFQPMLQEKAAKLRQQYGQDVPLSAENDQEFVKLANSQLEALRKQYEEGLAQAKAQLEALIS